MAQNSEGVKGKLLSLWIEDIRAGKIPGQYPEIKELSLSEIEEVMNLARFFGATVHEASFTSEEIYIHRDTVIKNVSEKQNEMEKLNQEIVRESKNFYFTINKVINSLGIDRDGLISYLKIPRATFVDLEQGNLPPHRLPQEKMIKLLQALHLVSEEIIETIKESSTQWAEMVYGGRRTQLGRVDMKVSNGQREELMRDTASLNPELSRINSYCSDLKELLKL